MYNPLEIERANFGLAVSDIKEFVKPAIKSHDKLIGIKSRYSNIDGSYELKSIDKNNYPIYYNKKDNIYIWHKIEEGNWYIGNNKNGSYYFAINSSEQDLTKIDKKTYKDYLDNIYKRKITSTEAKNIVTNIDMFNTVA